MDVGNDELVVESIFEHVSGDDSPAPSPAAETNPNPVVAATLANPKPPAAAAVATTEKRGWGRPKNSKNKESKASNSFDVTEFLQYMILNDRKEAKREREHKRHEVKQERLEA